MYKKYLILLFVITLSSFTLLSCDPQTNDDFDYIVNTKAELLRALAIASPGEVIHVSNSAEINLAIETDSSYERKSNILINEGITLRSGRGEYTKTGALLYTTQLATRPLFRINGPDVRITGLRIGGPDIWTNNNCNCNTSCQSNDCRENSVGILSNDPANINLEIDNNELYGWSHAAIQLRDYNGAVDKTSLYRIHIHHNYIHHNRRTGLGYGIQLDKAMARIQKNVFDHNRHAIAGTGKPGTGYEAGFNLVLAHGDKYKSGLFWYYEHSFDMHGTGSTGGQHTGDTAGTWISVHHNSFQFKKKYAFRLRGKPEDKAIFSYNTCFHTYAFQARKQDAPKGRFTKSNNIYNRRYRRPVFHDFDGDTRTDALMMAGRSWFLSKTAQIPWVHWRISNDIRSKLRFADFDGDGKTDVFKTEDGNWYVSLNGGRDPWQQIKSSTYTVNNIRFGDFNGDAIADVFKTNGTEWSVSYGGTTGWNFLKTSAVSLSSLAFGDFNGDGKTDVFRGNGSSWFISYSGTEPWVKVYSSSYTVSKLAFADFDADGETDVFRSSKGKWYVSYSATSGWTRINTSDYKVNDLHFGDFNGDNRADILRRDGSKWYVSWSGTGKWQRISTAFDGSHNFN